MLGETSSKMFRLKLKDRNGNEELIQQCRRLRTAVDSMYRYNRGMPCIPRSRVFPAEPVTINLDELENDPYYVEGPEAIVTMKWISPDHSRYSRSIRDADEVPIPSYRVGR